MYLFMAFILAAMAFLPGEPTECWYCAKSTDAFAHPEIERYENCAELVAGKLRFATEHLGRI